MGTPPIVPQRNVPIQDPDSPQAFSLPWYRFFQQSTAGGSLTPGQIAALEAAIAAAAAEAAAAQVTASEALAAATEAQSDAESALLVGLVDLGNEDAPGPQGLRGERGSPGWDGDDGMDAMPIPGPPGPPGLAGLFIPGMDGMDGEDGPIGAPGLAGAPGTTGATGATGAQGGIGMPGLDGDEGPEGMPIPSPPSFSANPSATIGLSAVNGTATTFMTSDSAPALSQGIVPTWTGAHTFSGGISAQNGTTAAPFYSYNTYSSAGANYERGIFGYSGNQLWAGTQKAGTGAARVMVFGTNLGGNPDAGLVFQGAGIRLFANSSNAENWDISSDNPSALCGGSTVKFGFASSATGIFNAASLDTILTRHAAANIQHGAADAASPVAQKISFQSVVAGNANTAGVNATIIGSLSNGSGASGDIIIQTGGTGAASGSQNTPVTALTVKGATQQCNFAAAFQVAGDTTGAGTTVGLGTNSPATTLSAPYTWIKMISSDGSTVYLPAYK